MKAFMVSVNGRRICTAGVGSDGVLDVILSWIGGPDRDADGDLVLQVGALDGRTDEHLRWPAPEVAVGDEIVIRIVETEHVDPEDSRRKSCGDPKGGGCGSRDQASVGCEAATESGQEASGQA